MVRWEDGPRLTDTYGRNLAYAYTVAGASIDEAPIAEGLALVWTRDGQHRDRLMGWSGRRRGRVRGACGEWLQRDLMT